MAYAIPSLIPRCAIPVATHPIQALAWSNVFIAIEKPLPSSPTKFAAGIRQSSNTTSHVFDVRIPILFSSLPVLNPGVPASTKNIEIPLTPFVLSVIAVIQ